MRFLFFFLYLLTPLSALYAQQTIQGRVVDNDATPLPEVVVQNLNQHNVLTTTNAQGQYTISAGKGDSIRFSLLGFSSRTIVFTGDNQGWLSWVALSNRNMVIDTVKVSGLTKYQKDSIARRTEYAGAMDYKTFKTQLPKLKDLKAGESVKIQGPLSGILDKHTRKSKRIAAFKEQFQQGEMALYLDAKYNADSVSVLTGLKGDSLSMFMQAYPMSYDYARSASDLEIKMWILYNYKQWRKQEMKP